jgi:hypothetical protein
MIQPGTSHVNAEASQRNRRTASSARPKVHSTVRVPWPSPMAVVAPQRGQTPAIDSYAAQAALRAAIIAWRPASKMIGSRLSTLGLAGSSKASDTVICTRGPSCMVSATATVADLSRTSQLKPTPRLTTDPSTRFVVEPRAALARPSLNYRYKTLIILVRAIVLARCHKG